MKSNFLYFLCVSYLLVFTLSAPAQVIISEFMADNKKTLADEDNQFPDWIELYNVNGAIAARKRNAHATRTSRRPRSRW